MPAGDLPIKRPAFALTRYGGQAPAVFDSNRIVADAAAQSLCDDPPAGGPTNLLVGLPDDPPAGGSSPS